MSRQIEIRTRGPCEHPKAVREEIRNGDGIRIAQRCNGCHRIVQLRACRGCRRRFLVTEASARRGKLYHSLRCRRKAARRRRAAREQGGPLDPRDT